MSEWPPLITDDALSTPSSLTSLESSPEPEPAAQKSLAIRDGGLKLNALGTTELTCASPGCGRTVDPTRTSGLCAVCEQKRHSEAEKEKLRVIPSMCGKNQVVSSAFASYLSFISALPAHAQTQESRGRRRRAVADPLTHLICLLNVIYIYIHSALLIEKTDLASPCRDRHVQSVPESSPFRLSYSPPSSSSAPSAKARCFLRTRWPAQ